MVENIKEKFKKNKIFILKIILSIINVLLILLLIFLGIKMYTNYKREKAFESSVLDFSEKNQNKIFSIDRIVFFTNSDAKNKTSSSSNFTIENLYTYTDIALFINKTSEENNLENTLKSVKMTNIQITKKPELGNPGLYYKSINNFAKSEFNEENKIEEELIFSITSEDTTNFDEPVLYNNCANPITISYINQNIKSDYTITDTQNPIVYDGSLLKRCGVTLNYIEANISFDIYVENNKNEKYKTSIYMKIPYEIEGKSIYDGNIIKKEETNFLFYRYE